tara:strand:- start:472 stop:828 length:357 start_codon:yes stop_codon:yes gene_type:complete
MNIHIEKLEAITIIAIEGDVESAEDLAQIIHASSNCEIGHENIILDLSSSGLKSFDFFNHLQCQQDNAQKSLVLCGVNKNLQLSLDEKFEEDYFNVVPTRNEAVDMVYMEEQERSFFN